MHNQMKIYTRKIQWKRQKAFSKRYLPLESMNRNWFSFVWQLKQIHLQWEEEDISWENLIIKKNKFKQWPKLFPNDFFVFN